MPRTSEDIRLSRLDRFIEEMPRHSFKIKPAAIAAGYSPSYAHANGKRILQSALKRQHEKMSQKIEAITHTELVAQNTAARKQTLIESLGYTEEDIDKEYKKILEQERDLSTKLKALAPLLRERGIVFDSEKPSVVAPILNITARSGAERDAIRERIAERSSTTSSFTDVESTGTIGGDDGVAGDD